jgi:hypothetical protein
MIMNDWVVVYKGMKGQWEHIMTWVWWGVTTWADGWWASTWGPQVGR